MRTSTALVFSALTAASAARFSPFSVAKSFSEHAVLQAAPRSARVWGWTDAGGIVTVKLNCSAVSVATTFNVSASADDGLWVAEFPPVPASTAPCVVAFSDVGSAASVWYLDILFGEGMFYFQRVRNKNIHGERQCSEVTEERHRTDQPSPAISDTAAHRLLFPLSSLLPFPYTHHHTSHHTRTHTLPLVSVIVCGGQSNQDLPLSYVENGTTSEPAIANNYGNLIRLLQLPLQAFSGAAPPAARPLRDFAAVVAWARASNVTASSFSAECWLTARDLFEQTRQAGGGAVPVGAIQSDWPGASITQLSSPAAVASCINVTGRSISAASPGSVDFPGPIPGPGPVSSQYNTMFAPLTVGPLQVGSFIYHQGEADVHGWYIPGFPHTHAAVFDWYSCALRALINDWRGALATPTSWFGVTMLQPYAGDCAPVDSCPFVPYLRAAQLAVAASMENVTVAVSTDLGGELPLSSSNGVSMPFSGLLVSALVACLPPSMRPSF